MNLGILETLLSVLLLSKILGKKYFVWSDNVFIYETKCLSRPLGDHWLRLGVCVHLYFSMVTTAPSFWGPAGLQTNKQT